MRVSTDPAELRAVLEQEPWIGRLARSLTRDQDVAEDLKQETRLILLQHRPRRRGERRWLATVMTNLLRGWHRSEGRRGSRERACQDLRSVPSDPEALLQRIELHRQLAQLVAGLPEPQRQTVILRYYEECSSAEIARRTGVPAATVRGRLKSGLDELRRRLDAHHEGSRARWLGLYAPLGLPFPDRGGLLERLPGARLAPVKTRSAAALAVLGAALGVATVWNALAPAEGDPGGAGASGQRDEEGPSPAALVFEERRRRPPPFWQSVASVPANPLASGPAAPAGDISPPDWFGQQGLPARAIAGRVLSVGRPLAHVPVWLESAASAALPSLKRERTTDAAGRFQFASQPAWLFVLGAGSEGRQSASVVVDLRDPRTNPGEVTLSLEPCGRRIRGRVLDDVGATIPGARVRQLADTPFAIGPESPAGAGAYEVCAGADAVWLQAHAPGYGAAVAELPAGSSRRDFVLVPQAMVVGQVLDAISGAPVAGAQINLWPRGVGLAPGFAVSGADGRFEIGGLAEGRYLPSVLAFDRTMRAAQPPIDVSSGQVFAPLDLRLHPASTVAGVILKGDRPLPAARVRLVARDGTESFSVISQGDGGFTVHAVPLGEVAFVVDGHRVVSPERLTIGPAAYSAVAVKVADADRPTCRCDPEPTQPSCSGPAFCQARIADTGACR